MRIRFRLLSGDGKHRVSSKIPLHDDKCGAGVLGFMKRIVRPDADPSRGSEYEAMGSALISPKASTGLFDGGCRYSDNSGQP